VEKLHNVPRLKLVNDERLIVTRGRLRMVEEVVKQ
jgi:hypothetical protein